MCNIIQLLHLNEINMRFYGAEYNNIEQNDYAKIVVSVEDIVHNKGSALCLQHWPLYGIVFANTTLLLLLCWLLYVDKIYWELISSYDILAYITKNYIALIYNAKTVHLLCQFHAGKIGFSAVCQAIYI
jgi:hypothetical protein